MNRYFTILVLLMSVYTTSSQCNITNRSLSINNVDTECSGNIVNGHIDNTIIVTTSCGNLHFTPPIVDIFVETFTHSVVNNLQLLVSPNPFLSEIEIKLDGLDGSYDIEITNIFGQSIVSKSHLEPNRYLRIDLSDYPSGTYFLLIKKDDRLVGTEKLIKLNS